MSVYRGNKFSIHFVEHEHRLVDGFSIVLWHQKREKKTQQKKIEARQKLRKWNFSWKISFSCF